MTHDWVYDNWSTLAAVDTIQGKYWEITNSDFYSNLAEYIMLFGMMDADEIANARGVLGQAQQSYRNNLIVGQRRIEEAQRRAAEIARQKRLQQQRYLAQQEAAQKASVQATNDFVGPMPILYPNTQFLPGLPAKSYWEKSWNQFIYGNYTQDVTLLGTAGQIASGFFGIDVFMDARDIIYDVSHWEPTWGHVGQTIIDVVAFFPVVGSVKYVDEAGALIKNSDELVAGVKGGKKSFQLTNNMHLTTNDALDAASEWLGPGYKDMGNGRFVSLDGTKSVRMGDSDITGKHGGGNHMNFEELIPNPNKPGKMQVESNYHIYLTD